MEKLDHFLPTGEILAGIKRQVVKAGVREEDIPLDWLSAISAAFAKHISTSEEGYNYISSLLNFNWQRGKINKQYTILNDIGQPIRDVSPNSIYIFTGVIAEGMRVPLSQVLVEDLPLFKCDGCGVRTHCVKEVVNWKRDNLESLCNLCLSYSEDSKQRDEATPGLCETCTDIMCTHNPEQMRNL